jgi:hypothetical protein
MQFIHDYWMGVVFCMIISLFLFWIAGYIGNGLFGCHFDLQSCWVGLSTVGGAGFTALSKYLIDSSLNSPKGHEPTKQDESRAV